MIEKNKNKNELLSILEALLNPNKKAGEKRYETLVHSINRTYKQFKLRSHDIHDIISELYIRAKKATENGKYTDIYPEAWIRKTSLFIIQEFKRKENKCIVMEPNSFDYKINSSHQRNSDDIEQLFSSLKKLKDKDRQILEWHYLENLRWKQIAERLSLSQGKDISEDYARQMGHRALKSLRKEYGDS